MNSEDIARVHAARRNVDKLEIRVDHDRGSVGDACLTRDTVQSLVESPRRGESGDDRVNSVVFRITSSYREDDLIGAATDSQVKNFVHSAGPRRNRTDY